MERLCFSAPYYKKSLLVLLAEYMYKESIKKAIEMFNVKNGLIKVKLKIIVFINLISL